MTDHGSLQPEGTADGVRSGRRSFLRAVAATSSVAVAGCFGSDDEQPRREVPFRAGRQQFERARGDGFEPFLIRGINMGMAKPGHFPGEAAIIREEYDRWFAAIGELNANAIRVYTIHPPAFYDALAAYNDGADEPLYLFQGTWIGEEQLLETGDINALSEPFHEELRRTVDVVHGETTLPERAGHASGEYESDISNYLLGYIPGIEWPPTVVLQANETGDGGEYEGEYVETNGGEPFDRWLAEAMDVIARRGIDEYDTQRPLSFTNWVTTDPLEHPYEPFEMEDAVAVDPDHINTTDAFEAGTFASYHVYPYYPDFLNHTPEYVEYVDHRGEQNSYAGYLADLTEQTDQALLIAEFGVPDSRGSAHEHVQGRDQGLHTEREQGEIVAAMYEDIVEAETAGGLVFTWQDEWFKRTWNLATFSEPNRRPFWSNVQTPEQRFGLLTFDPADRISLDGSLDDWEDATWIQPSGEQTTLGDGADRQRLLTGLAVQHDEAALSVLLEFDSLTALDWEEMNAIVALGHTGRGNRSLPDELDTDTPPTDFLVRLGGPEASRLLVDAYYDAFARRFGTEAGLDMEPYREQNSGRFTPSRMTINRSYTIPPTDEQVPFRSIETGLLRYGTGNPDSEAYDSLADVHVSRENHVIELRIPWLLLNVADPSSRLALADLWEGDLSSFEQFDSISVAAGTYAPTATGRARTIEGETNLTHAVPGIDSGRLDTASYSWEPWNEPTYRERQKQSYDIVRRQFAEYVD